MGLKKIQGIFLTGMFLLINLLALAMETTTEQGKPGCVTGCSGSTCSELFSAGDPGASRLFLLIAAAIMLTLYAWRKSGKKLYLAGGSLVTLALAGLLIFTAISNKSKAEKCDVSVNKKIGTVKQPLPEADFEMPAGEFEAVDSATRTDSTGEKPPKGSQSLAITHDTVLNPVESNTSSGEFKPLSDEFAPIDPVGTETEFSAVEEQQGKEAGRNYLLLYQLAVLFSLLILISFFMKYEDFRKTKGLFLLASVVYLGFIRGACPCMILSFQNTILTMLGNDIELISLVWFLGLIPVTYFFGKVWCGWLCHLGALQELLFRTPGLGLLKKRRSQKIMRMVRIVILIILLLQLLITRTNIFIHYDPFKVAFNLFSANTTGYVLLVLLLVSSVLIYRPFCRAVCPVGLILGWVVMIPGARRLTKQETCTDCVSCSKNCRYQALTYENKISTLDIQDCILCGDCLGSCRKNALQAVNFKK